MRQRNGQTISHLLKQLNHSIWVKVMVIETILLVNQPAHFHSSATIHYKVIRREKETVLEKIIINEGNDSPMTVPFTFIGGESIRTPASSQITSVLVSCSKGRGNPCVTSTLLSSIQGLMSFWITESPLLSHWVTRETIF